MHFHYELVKILMHFHYELNSQDFTCFFNFMLFISNTKKIVPSVITYPFIIHNNFKITLIQLLNIPNAAGTEDYFHYTTLYKFNGNGVTR